LVVGTRWEPVLPKRHQRLSNALAVRSC
jgi:hypothetical protein